MFCWKLHSCLVFFFLNLRKQLLPTSASAQRKSFLNRMYRDDQSAACLLHVRRGGRFLRHTDKEEFSQTESVVHPLQAASPCCIIMNKSSSFKNSYDTKTTAPRSTIWIREALIITSILNYMLFQNTKTWAVDKKIDFFKKCTYI